MRPLFTGLFLILICTAAFGQGMTDTVFSLKGVDIIGRRTAIIAKGQDFLEIDTIQLAAAQHVSLAEIIGKNSSIYLKSYGQGSLATISMRGTGPGHTGILWNGIQIRPPNIGYIDLSLIPAVFFDNIGILYGGSSSFFGSGNVAGALYLGNRIQFEQGHDLEVSLRGASFSAYDVSGKYSWSGKKVFSSTAIQYHNALNDFPYVDFYGEEVPVENAAVNLSGFMQDLGYKFGNNTLQGSLWYQSADREIPPTMTMADSKESQQDRSWRSLLSWKNEREKVSLLTTAGYFNDFLHYEDPSLDLVSEIISASYFAGFEGYFNLAASSRITGGLRIQQDEAESAYYDDKKEEGNLAMYAAWQHRFPRNNFYLNASARQELNSSFTVPFVFSLGAEGEILPYLALRGKISRDFKIPTINDRYWIPGGNDSLAPETSWNQEVGIDLKNKSEYFSNQISITIYNLIVNDWIQWYPTGGLWSAENLLKVWSRGLEINGKQDLRLRKVIINLREGYSLTKATQESKVTDNDPAYQKQLIYVPLNEFFVKLNLNLGGFSADAGIKYIGDVYTSKDNQGSLDSYVILDAGVSYRLSMKDHGLLLSFQVNNLLDENYQAIEYRPMPGRNYSISIKYNLKKDK